MRLRWKINFFVSGWCAMGAVVSALANAPYVLALSVFFAAACWYIADNGIQIDLQNKGE